MNMRWKGFGYKRTIKEWDAKTHEESYNDETKTSAEWVYKGEPVYSSLL